MVLSLLPALSFAHGGLSINLEAFETYLSQSDRTERVIKQCLQIMTRLQNNVQPLTAESLLTWLYELKRSGYKPGYLNRYVTVSKLYGKFIKDTELSTLKEFKVPRPLKHTLSDKQIEDFCALPCPPERSEKIHYRWSLFYKTAFFTGGRLGEVAKLNRKTDFIFGEKSYVIYRETKNDEERLIPITKRIVPELMQYIQDAPYDLVFASHTGRIVSDSDWNKEWRYRLGIMGIERIPGLTPHTTRHKAITRWLQHLNIMAARDLAGHKSVKTTEGYYHGNLDFLYNEIMKDPINKSVRPKEMVFDGIFNFIKNEVEGDERFDYRIFKKGNRRGLEIIELA